MNMSKKLNLLFALLLGLGLLLSACGTASSVAPAQAVSAPAVSVPTAAPTAVPTAAPKCSVTVGKDGSPKTFSGVFAALGMNYTTDDPDLIVNGVVMKKAKVDLQIDDFVVLAEKPNCTGFYSAAKKVDFGEYTKDLKSTTAWWRDVSGFKATIDEFRVNRAAADTCGDVRWAVDHKQFNGNVRTVGGGCNYTTFVKLSTPDGAVNCAKYASMTEAYNAVMATPNLNQVGWLLFFSVGNTTEDYCSK